MKPAKRRVIFVLAPGVHLLDLAGPVQTFDSANGCGCNYRLHFIGASPQVPSAVGLALTGFGPLIPANELDRNDLVIVPGVRWKGRTRNRLTLEVIAERCGFADVRHFRRLWTMTFGQSPSHFRKATANGHESKPRMDENQNQPQMNADRRR